MAGYSRWVLQLLSIFLSIQIAFCQVRLVKLEPDTDLQAKKYTGYTGHGRILNPALRPKDKDDWETLLGWACQALDFMKEKYKGKTQPGTVVVGYDDSKDELIIGTSIKGNNNPRKDMKWATDLGWTAQDKGLVKEYFECRDAVNKKFGKKDKNGEPISVEQSYAVARCGELSVYMQYFQLYKTLPFNLETPYRTAAVQWDPKVLEEQKKHVCVYLPPCGRQDSTLESKCTAEGWGCKQMSDQWGIRYPGLETPYPSPRQIKLTGPGGSDPYGDYLVCPRVPLKKGAKVQQCPKVKQAAPKKSPPGRRFAEVS